MQPYLEDDDGDDGLTERLFSQQRGLVGENNILQPSASVLPIAKWALTAANSYVRVFHVERKCDI